MESLKRSVSYSQPNICTSQGCNKSDTMPSWLSWLLCSRQIKASLSPLCSHLFLIGPGGWGRQDAEGRRAVPSSSAPSGGHVSTPETRVQGEDPPGELAGSPPKVEDQLWEGVAAKPLRFPAWGCCLIWLRREGPQSLGFLNLVRRCFPI